MTRAVNFLDFEIFDMNFEINFQKDIMMDSVAFVLPKKKW